MQCACETETEREREIVRARWAEKCEEDRRNGK